MNKKRHIDEVQPATVEEHYKLLLEDKSLIDPTWTEVTPDDLPDWYDEKLVKQAQQFYKRNVLSAGVASVIGLVAILTVPETLQVLIMTKQSSAVCTAFRRYAQTLLHIHMLFNNDEKDPNSRWYKSINVIRWKHANANRRAKNIGLGVLQRDMSITMFGFIGYLLIRPKEMSVKMSHQEKRAFIHFWRVTGHMLGISDRINLCRKSVEETTELCQKVSDGIIARYLREGPPNFLEITSVVLESMWYVDFNLDPEALLKLTYEISGVEYPKPLGWKSWINWKHRQFVLYLCRTPYIGVVVRTYYNNLLYFLYWMLEHYPVCAILGLGKEHARIQLYPKIK